MYIVREIFHLKFGFFREAKSLIDEGIRKNLLLQPPGTRIWSDFTGESSRLIIELPYATLGEYERDLKKELAGNAWQDWYEQFKALIRSSEREILKQVL